MITRVLIALNALAYVYEIVKLGPGIFSGNVSLQGLYDAGALVPAAVTQDHEYWRIVSGAFMHASFVHIAVNMFSLWILGRFIETALGSWRMLFVYLVSLVASGWGVVHFSNPLDVTVGASGAIFGLFGALFALGFKLGERGMELVKANIGILVLNLAFTFFVPGISKAAHVAGLLAGFLITLAIYYPPKPVRAYVVDAQSGQELESTIESPTGN
ncbi:MAG: rhomboid family intramembrane serine protease [Vulcanimicrobiaceae bacterium]